METLTINYHSESSELCEIGKKYDTDKSSQRNHITHYRHCHPYTLFYDSLFKHRRNEPLQIAELGILYGGSLLMWKDYFLNATIYGFEYNDKLIDKFKKNCDNDRITLAKIDVKHADSIIDAFRTLNVMYDIIIEDTTHKFEDQLRVIEHVHPYLKPGGILIIEDIFKSVDVNDYRIALQHLLYHFQTYYFVELDHVNKYSAQWNNDKLFVLVKGEEPH
jgi:predicted O-methyltransferase YrrM